MLVPPEVSPAGRPCLDAVEVTVEVAVGDHDDAKRPWWTVIV
jgi:hypothetical protein